MQTILMIRFDDDEARSNRTNQETSRAALERYLFYCNRLVKVQIQKKRMKLKLRCWEFLRWEICEHQ